MSKKKHGTDENLLPRVQGWVPDFMREDERKRQLFYLVKRTCTNLISEGRRRKLLEEDIDFALLTAMLHEVADVVSEGLLDKWKPQGTGGKG